MELTFDEALARIDALEPRGWRLGLDRMRAFCDHAALAHWIKGDAPQFIHVAGTNGKGSTTAFVERLLREAGFRTGAFFSPFVKEYRERIQVNGELITEADLTLFTGRLLQQADTFEDSEFGGITKFEFEAALGFLVWGEKRCDWVALEVGLGGRLDATNVFLPKCSIIVSIGLDHVAILGGSLPEIAREKAGIIKPLVPVIIGEMAEEASEVIEAKAAEMGAPVWRFGQEI
jgi:dihydrofolate synthase/folylpolyglutamate synthase